MKKIMCLIIVLLFLSGCNCYDPNDNFCNYRIRTDGEKLCKDKGLTFAWDRTTLKHDFVCVNNTRLLEYKLKDAYNGDRIINKSNNGFNWDRYYGDE